MERKRVEVGSKKGQSLALGLREGGILREEVFLGGKWGRQGIS